MGEILQTIQPVDLSPPGSGRTFLSNAENAENPMFKGDLALGRRNGSARSRPERLVNTTHQDGETAGNLFPSRSGGIAMTLPDCARHLTRLRPAYSQDAQRHISTLIEQCKNYERGNTYLARRMLETMDRIGSPNL